MSSKADGPSGADRSEGQAVDSAAVLRDTGAAIAAAVDELGAAYLVRVTREVVDAWGRFGGAERARLDVELGDAAGRAARRVAGELRSLLVEPATHQRTTPLALVRTLPREPTEVLSAAGIPAVVRDEFDERAWPDDRYGLVPRSFADLGDPELGHLHLAWGMAKAQVLREPPRSPESDDSHSR